MIRSEYKYAGYQISKRSPIICTTYKDRRIKYFVVYNRYDLKEVIKNHRVIFLLGVWSGLVNTDCFVLDVQAYSDLAVPPKEHKDIDSAQKIRVYFENNVFVKVSYLPTSFKLIVPIECDDVALYNYIQSIGLKYERILG